MRPTLRTILFGAAAVAALACSNSNGSTGPNNNNNSPFGTMTASVSGVAFNGIGVAGSYVNNVLAIGGGESSGQSVKTITITLNNVTGPGTYSLTSIASGAAVYTEASGGIASSWNTALAGGGGQVIVTQLSSNRAVGTFSFTAPASTQTAATGTKSVTNGSFNIVVQ